MQFCAGSTLVSHGDSSVQHAGSADRDAHAYADPHRNPYAYHHPHPDGHPNAYSNVSMARLPWTNSDLSG